MRKVLHRQIYRRNAFGGVVNTTLCNRVRNERDYNVAERDEDVTCRFCRRILDDPIAKMWALKNAVAP